MITNPKANSFVGLVEHVPKRVIPAFAVRETPKNKIV